jgi:ABC-type sulfate/molybdate transport systems ATPase subunit
VLAPLFALAPPVALPQGRITTAIVSLHTSPCTFCVPAASGERLCVFGSEAGSGRSVLLSVLAGLRQPSDGAVSLLGVDSKQVLRGMTLGTTNMQRDKVHGA